VKGYEVSKDEYILVTQDEIDAVKLESTKTMISSGSSPRPRSTASTGISPISSALRASWPRKPSA
jgi:non-homologous end joining protein Ku